MIYLCLIIATRSLVTTWRKDGGELRALAQRKAGGILRRPQGTPGRPSPRVPVRRPEPGSPRTPGRERLLAGSHERLADLFKPRYTSGREHPLARIVLGILRTLLR